MRREGKEGKREKERKKERKKEEEKKGDLYNVDVS